MLSIFDIGTPEEALDFYEDLGADLTPVEAFALWCRFRRLFSRDVPHEERETEYQKYCSLVKAVQRGEKSRLWANLERDGKTFHHPEETERIQTGEK